MAHAQLQIEQNRCAMACQGCGAVFLLSLYTYAMLGYPLERETQVAHFVKLCYNFIRLGKQVQLLYEPVAVRHIEIPGILPEKHNSSRYFAVSRKPQFRDKPLENI